ncbi:serine--tRNA ligase [Candidatus Uhrbacteria bacterium]|nr:serine--tRNA ligase [Candidatus Uhrbacteria bacterium]
MIDLKLLREHPEDVERGIQTKGYTVDISHILELDAKKRELQGHVEAIAAQKNAASAEIAKASIEERKRLLKALQKVDAKADASAERLDALTKEFDAALWTVPNLPASDVKVGKDETENEVLRTWGEIPQFPFVPKAAWELGPRLGAFDVERAARVSGARFAYLTGAGARIELALLNHAMRTLIAEGFIPVTPPVLVNAKAMEAMGYTLHGGKDETYYLERDDQYLVGTSEQSIGPMHMGEVLREADLPKRYVAFSTCFRRESGSYGRDTKGIFRVHQFNKVEMFSFTTPEQSDAEHEYLLGLEERFLQALELPYQVVKMCTGDLGVPAARKYDLEVWFPSERRYRELTSTSSCTDWQARRLNIRYRPSEGGGKPRFVHTLNGTAWSMNRPICAILEHGQQADGSVVLPKALRESFGAERIAPVQ